MVFFDKQNLNISIESKDASFLCISILYHIWSLLALLGWRRQWHPTPVLLPGKFHGWRSLVGWSPWGRWGSDMTEQFYFHFSLSCIGEGNGNPLQCSCLENPRDGGAWWAAVSGVAQSRTWLKRLSSSSSSFTGKDFFFLLFCHFAFKYSCMCNLFCYGV